MLSDAPFDAEQHPSTSSQQTPITPASEDEALRCPDEPDCGITSEEVFEQEDDLAPEDALKAVAPLWQNKNFMCLWFAQVFGQLADRVVFVVFITAIARQFAATPANMEAYNTGLYMAFTIPAVTLTIVAGVFVDRWSRRATLVLSTMARAVSLLFLPWTLATHHIGWIYTLAFFQSAATQFFVPAEAASIPLVVHESQLIEANALFTTTMMASIIFGFVLGDAFLSQFRPEHIHYAVASLFAIGGMILLGFNPKRDTRFITMQEEHPSEVSSSLDTTLQEEDTQNTASKEALKATLSEAWTQFCQDMGEGIAFLKSSPITLYSLGQLSLLFAMVVGLTLLFIAMSKQWLFADATVGSQKFGYFIALSGVGMTLGALWLSQKSQSYTWAQRRVLIHVGSLLLSGFISALALTPWVFPEAQLPSYLSPLFPKLTARMLYVGVCNLWLGFAAALMAIPLQALLQLLIPEDKRGKVMGVQYTMISIASTLPAMAVGFLTPTWGITGLLLCAALPFGIVPWLKAPPLPERLASTS
ncbi:MAG: MFS transporter [Vampirovibrionales bacterium]